MATQKENFVTLHCRAWKWSALLGGFQKLLSIGRATEVKVDYQWLSRLQKVPICMVKDVIMRVHLMECQPSLHTAHPYSSGILVDCLQNY